MKNLQLKTLDDVIDRLWSTVGQIDKKVGESGRERESNPELIKLSKEKALLVEEILEVGEFHSIPNLAYNLGLSDQTIYRWQKSLPKRFGLSRPTRPQLDKIRELVRRNFDFIPFSDPINFLAQIQEFAGIPLSPESLRCLLSDFELATKQKSKSTDCPE